jgi:PIN domain nuclease of toxin-antitoxin system
VKLLIDTHVALWALEDYRLLSADMVRVLRSLPRPRFVVSAASIWEISIKAAKGQLRAPADLPRRLLGQGFELLPVTPEHAWAVRGLSGELANRDPFDRLIYVQAKLEGLTLATRDAVLLRSGLDVVHA